MELGYCQPGFLSIIAPLKLARETPLPSLQLPLPSEQRPRILEFLSVTGPGLGLNPHFSFNLLQRLDVGFHQNADKVALPLILVDSQINQPGICGKRTTPDNIQTRRLLGERDLTLSVSEGIGSVSNRLVSVFRFEPGVVRSLLEKVSERRFEIAQRLLQNDGTDLVEKGSLRFLFPLCQFRGRLVIAYRLLLLLPSGSTIGQGLIVYVAGATEGLSKLPGLFLSWKESILESLLYYHGGILH
jgi:hypothetical protein